MNISKHKAKKIDTEPSLLAAIYNNLNAWKTCQHLPDLQQIPTDLQQPLLDIRQILYDIFLEGIIPKLVIHYQQKYNTTQIESRKTAEQ